MNGPAIVCEGETLALLPDESVLECLLRHERPVGHSCRAGHCQACLVKGSPAPPEAQVGLKPTLVEQGYFLACQARPEGKIELQGTAGLERRRAAVLEHQLIAEEVLRLRLRVEDDLDYRPGQFVNVCHPDGSVRSYSLASHLDEPFLELHVRRVPGGHVSGWLHDSVTPGTIFDLEGPHGSCFYVAGRADQPLVLAGTGTGLAPLWGILRDALAHGHQGPIHLLQGALHAERLYLREELGAMARQEPQFHLHLCAMEGAQGEVSSAPIDQLATDIARTEKAPRAFLCGDPGVVRKLQRSLFLGGVASAEILADPFLPTPAA